jgi:hypothetical protein
MTGGHIRQRSTGSWELRYSAGTDPVTGKRKTITTTFRGNKRDAEKELRRLLHTVDIGEHVDPTRITVGRWLEDWLASIRPSKAPRTHHRYSELVAHYLSPALGNVPLAKLTPAHIQRAYNGWYLDGRRDR